ncbi:DUF3300 domain-containing protein [Roseomonas sp. PWR1]|uniref:DUF3300 domain-containing protein n=1 Tax=Roseomonas nitratireducens TaxID=2820810 RepID=A0ABS4B0A5_9PROT|nr:DUF3300 domain-containing protein [Neoroseomonas nitratireducens]MBP0466272.1 DUF3300 domain-containing protein [Neoroseomonas nitratireducens]
MQHPAALGEVARWAGWRRALAVAICGGIGCTTVAGLALQRAAAQGTPPPAAAAPAVVATTAGQERLSQAQLEQLLAPIALHPDTLLTQMLMAATYPLEIVQAKRWLGRDQNAALRGAALEQALQSQPWDASVKSLVPFPDVLTLMNDELEWTQQVGDAVLAQQQDVLNAIQALRGRAQANGALQSGPQQIVTVTQNVAAPPAAASATAVPPPTQIITIAPAQPETVYVPAYNPQVVYGSWPYPQYPPPYYPPPVGWGVGSALLTGMAFAGGVAIANNLWGWSSANWGGGDININASRVNNINRNTNVTGGSWRHDTTHRQGVAYRGDEVRNRYQGDRQQQAASREQFRGRTQQPGGALGGADRPGAGQGARPGGDRPGAGPGDRPGGDRPGAGQGTRPGGDRPGAGPGDRPGGDRPGAGQDARPGGDRPGAGTADRPGGDRPAAGQRPAGGERPAAGGGQRPGGAAAQRPTAQPRPSGVSPSGRPQVQSQPAGGQRAGGGGGGQGFQGMGQGGQVQAASQRGASSRQSAGTHAASRPGGGGGGRGGGGGGGRGGRR